MRFLTREWIEHEFDEPTGFINLQVYLRHLEELAHDLPEGARLFALLSGGLRLQFASIVATTLDEDAGTFNLVVRIEGQDGDYFFELEYLGVDPAQIDIDAFDMAETCLTEEFDYGPDGTFEHRILLQPDGEATIRFSDMRLHAKRSNNEHEDPE